MTTVHITASLEYDVLIEHGIIDRAGELAGAVLKGKTICIVSDDNVFPIYGERVMKSFEAAGFRVLSFVFPHGEKSKSPWTLPDSFAVPGESWHPFPNQPPTENRQTP